MAYTHGVYTTEQDTSVTSPISSPSALQVIFGTAPVHLLADPYSATNVPKKCSTYAEAVEAVGYSDNFEKFTLCQSVDACFIRYNVAPIILVNVLDPTKSSHISENADASYTAVDDEIAYPKTMVLLDTIVVKNGDDTLTEGTDYVTSHQDDDTVLITLLSTTAQNATSLTISSTSLNPSGVTTTDLVGGVDAETGAETGLELLRQVFPLFSLVPALILAPGWSHDAVVAAAMQAKTTGLNGVFDCNCILDIGTDEDGAEVYTDVAEAKEDLGATSNHAIAVWPMVEIDGNIYYYSAILGAVIATTDANNSDVPYVSPSNKTLNIAGTVLADGTSVTLDLEQGNLLNGQGIVTAINFSGFRTWGNNTAAYPSTTDMKDRWIAIRRFFDWDGNEFILTYFEKVDDPANTRLIQAVVDSANIKGNGFVAKDYCAGYNVSFNSADNTVTDLLDGKLTIKTNMAPYGPAETIINDREYDVSALVAALGG